MANPKLDAANEAAKLNPRYVPIELRPAPFEGKKNGFIAPSKPLIVPTLRRDVAVSKSLADLGQVANVNLIKCAPVQEDKPKRRSNAAKVVPVVTVVTQRITWTQAHVLSDELFITYTRGMTVHSKGGMNLFMANGGAEIKDLHATLAFAWEALRKGKLSKLAGVTAGEYRRHNPINPNTHHVYRSPLQQDPYVRARAIEESRSRQSDEQWLSSALPSAKRTA